QARQRSSDDDDPTKGGVALGGVQASPDSEVSRRLDLLMDKSFGDLQFLSDEFSKLEVVVAPAVQERDDSGKAGTDSKLGRLRFFTTHVRRTMARIRDARSGRDPMSMSQLALLEEHIATATEGDGGGGGGGVSSSRSSSVSSSMGGRAGAEELVGAGREEEEEWSVGLELHDEAFGSGGSVSLGLVSPAPASVPDRGADGGIYDPHACSARLTPASSSSSLSRLCWGSGGGTGGSAGGGGRDVARGGRPHRHTRRDHVDMLSQLEAEGVFAADDSYSPCGGGGGSRGGGGMGGVASSGFPAALLQPREVRYQCGACAASYAATVSGNPWWLLVRQECPICHKMQIPRVDILNPTNNVESHIAFLTENASDGDGSCMDWDGETSDDNSGDEYSGDERQGLSAGGSMSGGDGSGHGPTLDSDQAAKLLVLMCHARHCPGNHRSARLAEVCRSVKFLMLHLRDCDGKTRNGDPCPMPWCEPCMSLLHHLIQCPESTGYRGHEHKNRGDLPSQTPSDFGRLRTLRFAAVFS
ncbi:unnamed protein product, partial [Ectocarpus sp. 6 AP-2014]